MVKSHILQILNKRKSFRRFLKASPEIQRSYRLDDEHMDSEIDNGLILQLKPTGIDTDESKDKHEPHVPILTNEDNIIQEQETFSHSRARKINFIKQK